MTTEPILRAEHVHKSFGETHVLKGVSLTIQPREVVVLVGPSGTGKSTLLRCINLLSPPTQGKIWLEAEEITAPGVNQVVSGTVNIRAGTFAGAGTISADGGTTGGGNHVGGGGGRVAIRYQTLFMLPPAGLTARGGDGDFGDGQDGTIVILSGP